jgi:hypothetical protein
VTWWQSAFDRDRRLLAAGWSVEPFLAHIPLAVEEGATSRTRIGQKDADLLILPSPCRAAVLARHPRRFRAFLHEARFIHNEHGIRLSQLVHHLVAQGIAHRFHIPLCLIQQTLDTTRMRFTTVFGELPAVLAFGGVEQSLQLAPRPPARLTAAKVRCNALVRLRRHPVPLHRWTGHEPPPSGSLYQVSVAVVVEAIAKAN